MSRPNFSVNKMSLTVLSWKLDTVCIAVSIICDNKFIFHETLLYPISKYFNMWVSSSRPKPTKRHNSSFPNAYCYFVAQTWCIEFMAVPCCRVRIKLVNWAISTIDWTVALIKRISELPDDQGICYYYSLSKRKKINLITYQIKIAYSSNNDYRPFATILLVYLQSWCMCFFHFIKFQISNSSQQVSRCGTLWQQTF